MSDLFPRFSAGIGHLFTEWDLLDRFAIARDHGFEGVELTLPYNKTPEELQRAKHAAGLEVIIFTAPLGDFMQGGEGIAAVPGQQQAFNASLNVALEYAQALDAQFIQIVSGRCFDQEKNPDKRDLYFNTFVCNVERAAEAFHNYKTNVALEAINTRDFTDYLLNLPEHLWQLLDTSKRSDIAVEFDSLHASVMGVDISKEILTNGKRYAHLQLADAPNRSPPGTGVLDFPSIYRAINTSGYRGWIGTEYHPGEGGSLNSLAWMEQAREALGAK